MPKGKSVLNCNLMTHSVSSMQWYLSSLVVQYFFMASYIADIISKSRSASKKQLFTEVSLNASVNVCWNRLIAGLFHCFSVHQPQK